MATEKRNFSGISFSSKKSQPPEGHVATSTKLRNFFRINSTGSQATIGADGLPTPKSDVKTNKSSRMFPGLGRNRSTTTASEGHTLEDAVSPTAHANPYYIHQGPPNLRHHNDGSVPPSPPDTPKVQVNGIEKQPDSPVTAGKEELARKLRRVASAPNAQGLFKGGKAGDRPNTAELGKDPVFVQPGPMPQIDIEPLPEPIQAAGAILPDPGKLPLPGQIRQAAAFRRTYSSNSIKVRNVEVGPSSFDKIKLIGKGDVGKVYLVREKKSNRLYAMKGIFPSSICDDAADPSRSFEQERNDQAKQDQKSIGRARNFSNE